MTARNTKSANILIRATPAQKRAIRRRAQRFGLTVSDYMRMTALVFAPPLAEESTREKGNEPCDARVFLGDQGHARCITCQLAGGHDGPHWKSFEKGGRIIVVTWVEEEGEDDLGATHHGQS